MVDKVKRKKILGIKPTHFSLRVFSRHPSTKPIRKTDRNPGILIPGKKVVYRHGSTSDSSLKYEINSAESVRISADKLRMKRAFDKAGVKHARWVPLPECKNKISWNKFLKDAGFPENRLIAKNRTGSRGTGNYLIKTQADLDAFIRQRAGSLDQYIIEEYKPFKVEYRLHVTERGCFYTCRKVLKSNTPKEERFQRHSDNCAWLVETNPKFDKPDNWKEIVDDCIKALKAIGADVLAFDVKCTSKKNAKEGKVNWIILESCSAPAFGEKMTEKYKVELPLIVKHKYA